jgi:hypothetical protein
VEERAIAFYAQERYCDAITHLSALYQLAAAFHSK